jgi:hypothetical protein
MSCSNGACEAAFSANSSLRQGQQFADLTKAYHGGRRHRSRRHRRSSRRAHSRRHRMRGGSYAAFPGEFSQVLPQDMHAAADISSLDKAFAQLPQFAGKYGMTGGSRRHSRRRSTRRQRGGVAPVDAPGVILSPGEEGQAFLNPQWYNENLVNPNFRGPVVQKAGKRSSRSRRNRRVSRRSVRSRKMRKMHGGADCSDYCEYSDDHEHKWKPMAFLFGKFECTNKKGNVKCPCTFHSELLDNIITFSTM